MGPFDQHLQIPAALFIRDSVILNRMVQEGRLEFPSRHVSVLVLWRDKKKPFRNYFAWECMSYTLCLAIRILGEFELTWLHMSSSYSFLELSSTSFAISFRRLCRAFRATPSSQVSSLPKSKNMLGEILWHRERQHAFTTGMVCHEHVWTLLEKVCLNCFFNYTLHTYSYYV